MQQRSTTPTINENLTAHLLPRDKYIENYLAGVKVCYNEEIYFNYFEYLVIIEGTFAIQSED
jgi:hypothetical protein